MKLSIRSLAATAVAAVLAATQPVAAEVPESTDPIKIVTNNWTSQLVLANVVGQLLQKMGYNVEYKPSDTQLQFTAIANGDMDFQVEVWEGSMWPSFKAAMDTGGLVDLGSHDAVTREEWWYPTYVEEVCPGLPDWKALDACADKFSTAETKPQGRFVVSVAYDPGLSLIRRLRHAPDRGRYTQIYEAVRAAAKALRAAR